MQLERWTLSRRLHFRAYTVVHLKLQEAPDSSIIRLLVRCETFDWFTERITQFPGGS
jgi:hypothetical protein